MAGRPAVQKQVIAKQKKNIKSFTGSKPASPSQLANESHPSQVSEGTAAGEGSGEGR